MAVKAKDTAKNENIGDFGRAPACVCRRLGRGTTKGMPLSLLLIVIGILLAVLVNYALGIICIVIGLVLLLVPYLRGRTSRI
jgi:hypothetical protein